MGRSCTVLARSAKNWSCSRFCSTIVLTTPITIRKTVVIAIRPASSRARSDHRRGAQRDLTAGASGRGAEAVPYAALSVDERRPERVQLAPQVGDVCLHHLRLPAELPAPHVLQ